MKRIIALFLLGIFSLGRESMAATNDSPDFNEVRELLRANLPGVTDAELNRAAVEGLLAGFQWRVALLGKTNPIVTDAALLSRKMLLVDDVGYVRVRQVAKGLDREISAAVRELGLSNELNNDHNNKLKGVVLDLRYATGVDYAAVGSVADLFVSKTRPLLDYGHGMISAKSSPEDLNLPLMVLINGDTAGAAEALAGVLRTSGAGLLLGSRTAGRGMFMKEFTLKSGKVISLASGQVVLGNGRALTTEGLLPDVAVKVQPDEELAYFADAFAELKKNNAQIVAATGAAQAAVATNSPPRKRMTEALLVRQHREGDEGDGVDGGNEEPAQPGRGERGGKPELRDPVLVRAVDLLKGLAILGTTADE